MKIRDLIGRYPLWKNQADDDAVRTAADGMGANDDGAIVYRPPPAVRAETATAMPIVYACVRLISGTIAAMPVHIYRREDDGDRVRVYQQAERLLNQRPSDGWTGASFKEFVMRSVLLYGDGFAYIQRDGMGFPVALYPIHPTLVNRIERKRDEQGDPYLQYEILPALDGDDLPGELRRDRMIRLRDWNVLHVPNHGFNGLRSPSTIHGARTALGLQFVLDGYAKDYFHSGAQSQYVISTGGDWTKEDRQNYAKWWRDTYATGSSSRRLPMVLKGGDVKRLDVNPEDQQLLASRKFGIEEIARAFGIPSFLVQLEEKSTSFGQGIAKIFAAWHRTGLLPHTDRFEQELTAKLLPDMEAFVRLDISGLERATQKERYDGHRIALGGGSVPGWATVNEIRKLEELPRIDDPAYDLPYRPPATPVMQLKPVDDEPDESDQDDEEDEDDDEQQAD